MLHAPDASRSARQSASRLHFSENRLRASPDFGTTAPDARRSARYPASRRFIFRKTAWELRLTSALPCAWCTPLRAYPASRRFDPEDHWKSQTISD